MSIRVGGAHVWLLAVCVTCTLMTASGERVAMRVGGGGDMATHRLGPTAHEALRMSERLSGMALYRALKARWKPRVYVYDLPEGLDYAWACGGNVVRCWKETYGGELGVLYALREGGYVTEDAEEADLFFVPTYFRQARLRRGQYNAGEHVVRLIEWLREMPYWDRHHQADHMVSVWADEGMVAMRRFQPPNPAELLRNVSVIGFEGRLHPDGHDPARDVNVPVMYLMRSMIDLVAPGPARERDWFAFFCGTVWEHNPKYSRGTRRVLFEHFRSDNLTHALARGDGMVVLHRDDRSTHFSEGMMRSKFCLHLAGMGAWTPRLVQAVLAECVPVIIMDNASQPFDARDGGFLDYGAFSVTVADADIPTLPAILHTVEASGRLAALQRGVREVKRHFVFPLDGDTRRGRPHPVPHRDDDAIDMLVYEAALKSLVRRARAQ